MDHSTSSSGSERESSLPTSTNKHTQKYVNSVCTSFPQATNLLYHLYSPAFNEFARRARGERRRAQRIICNTASQHHYSDTLHFFRDALESVSGSRSTFVVLKRLSVFRMN